MSLSYYAEHLAWQQRIQRETFNSNKFYQYSPRRFLDSLPRKRSWSSTHSNGPPPSNPNLLRDTPFHHSPAKHTVISDSAYGRLSSPSKSIRRKHSQQSHGEFRSRKSMTVYRGPAEVRGKYAPPFTEPTASKSAERKHGNNPILGRPATAGTLKRKLRLVDTSVQVETEVKTPTQKSLEAKTRPRSAVIGRGRSRGFAETMYHLADAQPEAKHIEPILKPDLVAMAEPVPADPVQAEVPVEAPQADDGDRPVTSGTWKTTSTQRKYIEELERLLREERKRRVMAEAKLQT